MFRVDSRLAQSVSHASVYAALSSMSSATKNHLREAVREGGGRYFLIVSDNIQTYAKQRDHRIGRENRMIKGLAATAVEMQDVDPQGFDTKELIRRQGLHERKTLTVDTITEDIDWEHLERAASYQFLEAIIKFVPALSVYRKQLDELSKTSLEINPIPPTRHTNVTPLATNSSDEMYVQELKHGVLDFLSTQMGVDADSYDGRAWIFSGDGKTFDQLLKMRKYLSVDEQEFSSFRWLVPLLELWHTKWTDLSRIIRTHWGVKTDSSSLAALADTIDYSTPSNLRKVDFYQGARLVNLALDAHLINCWE